MATVSASPRSGKIRFYLFDSSFELRAERTWDAAAQDRSRWFPLDAWPADTYNYETINLIKARAPGSSEPSYFMIMYHSTDAADIYSIHPEGMEGSAVRQWHSAWGDSPERPCLPASTLSGWVTTRNAVPRVEILGFVPRPFQGPSNDEPLGYRED